MSVNALEQHTYQPADTEVEGLGRLLSFMEAHETKRGDRPSPRYLLVGADEHDHEEIPEVVYPVLRQILRDMKAGKAIVVTPHDTMVTTQQAADFLGVSRPTVIKLIERGELRAETPGKRRRLIRFAELVEYREQRREAQYRALFETAADLDEDPEVLAEELKKARAEVAAKRARD